jgi:hypothetical protein
VYAAAVDGRDLTFGLEGSQWNDTMIMYDNETKTLWTQMFGESVEGPLKGKSLRSLPSIMTDWQTWKTRYPDSTVAMMPVKRHFYQRNYYQPLGRFVAAIVTGSTSKAWGLDKLDQKRTINEEWQGEPIVVVFEKQSITVRIFKRTCQSRVLTFRFENEKLIDEETKSVWDPITGKALSGSMAGQFLTPLPTLVGYRETYLKNFPNSYW